MSEAEKQVIIDGGNLGYIQIGATHMLSGYDHLAFIFGIVFYLTRFKEIVKYITVFTIAHSITLIAATFNQIQINYLLIDAVIALSVSYIAFRNLDGFKKYLNVKEPNLLAMIFGLGLIHGLGLSTRLQQLPLNTEQLLTNIISFNVGIELGQILALSIMLIFITLFRKSHSFPIFNKTSNYFLIFAGLFIFLMQMHDYRHSTNAKELTLNAGPAPQEEILTVKSEKPEWKDTILITIPARRGLEYKLLLAEGATLEYQWKADKGRLFFDLHGDPEGDTTGYFKSFTKGTKALASGSLTSVFKGVHGWYWKNNNTFPVIVTLNVDGEYQRIDLAPNTKKTKVD